MNKQIKLTFNEIQVDIKGYTVEEAIKIIDVLPFNISPKKIKTAENIEKKVSESKNNTVNYKEIARDMRMPKTYNYFKCPNCAQSIIMKHFDGNMYVRDIVGEKPKMHIIDEVIIPNLYTQDGNLDKERISSVYKDLLNILGDEKMFVDVSYSEINKCHCPICKKDNNIKDWIKAYEEPLDVFDESSLCDICGDETEILILRDGTSLSSCKNKCLEKLK